VEIRNGDTSEDLWGGTELIHHQYQKGYERKSQDLSQGETQRICSCSSKPKKGGKI
jgi:hypothetical protein